ncbi:M15 family metallopeptidase [Roseateles amylovorans]|uniref:D-alanyl-D-alanine dipeptidase n=1 Tax=Roseateles amylovorans TaxID=2978473 RepID=A0ABY6B1F5_9BURK|nr:M15 family metallopeptidase [Roseateles amylovorans]UXH78675.1 M15 family metallopeptidase [Roseateles amylovorans]
MSRPEPAIPCEEIAAHPEFRALLTLPGIAIDLRYATPDNFVGRNVYGGLDCAYLRQEAAAALVEAAGWLSRHQPDLTLVVLDALRPQRVQEALWAELEGTPLTKYLAHPARRSIHSFGMAVDVTLLDAHGRELDMGTAFDEMTPASHPEFEAEQLAQGGLTASQLQHRGWLRAAMRHAGFQTISTEWWHFDFGDREQVRRTLPLVL